MSLYQSVRSMLRSKATYPTGMAPPQPKPKSTKGRQPPAGEVRLTINIRSQLRERLRARAVHEQTTMTALIEHWIESWPELLDKIADKKRWLEVRSPLIDKKHWAESWPARAPKERKPKAK